MTSPFAFHASTRILTRVRIGPDIFETTLRGGFRKVRFRAPDPSGRSAETHKTYAVSPRKRLRVEGSPLPPFFHTLVDQELEEGGNVPVL